MTSMFSSHLFVLACPATKREGPAYMPAIEVVGGLLAANTLIKMYDVRMAERTAAAMSAGGHAG